MGADDRQSAGTRYDAAVAVVAEPDSVLLPGHDVPLGRYTTVRRLLPQRPRRMVGGWCFVDQFGPDDVAGKPGMRVPPHPHTGLQTVTWLVEGEVLTGLPTWTYSYRVTLVTPVMCGTRTSETIPRWS